MFTLDKPTSCNDPASFENRVPLVVIEISRRPTFLSLFTISTMSWRSIGSPPVSLTASIPKRERMLRMRCISSAVINVDEEDLMPSM